MGAGTVTDFLDRLAARALTSVGGPVAALWTALAAVIVAIVARYCGASALVERAERLVTHARQLLADDERAFGTVAEARAVPRGMWLDAEERHSTIGEALLGASEPQAQVVETAIEVLVLIDLLRPAGGFGPPSPTWLRPVRWPRQGRLP